MPQITSAVTTLVSANAAPQAFSPISHASRENTFEMAADRRSVSPQPPSPIALPATATASKPSTNVAALLNETPWYRERIERIVEGEAQAYLQLGMSIVTRDQSWPLLKRVRHGLLDSLQNHPGWRRFVPGASKHLESLVDDGRRVAKAHLDLTAAAANNALVELMARYPRVDVGAQMQADLVQARKTDESYNLTHRIVDEGMRNFRAAEFKCALDLAGHTFKAKVTADACY